jgi:hypothetical protein
MSKKNEYGETELPGTNEAPTFCAIEEHAKSLNVSAPVFAAVRQSQGWAAGKNVEQTEFKKAVNAFLGAPMKGGK